MEIVKVAGRRRLAKDKYLFDDARIYQVCKQSSNKIVNIVVVTNIVNLCEFDLDLQANSQSFISMSFSR